MIPALNLGSSSMPGGMTQNHVPDDWCDDCNRGPCECVCLGCDCDECVCGEDDAEDLIAQDIQETNYRREDGQWM